MTPERTLIQSVLRSLDPARDRLFRINAGVGWTGSRVKRDENHVVIVNPRVLRAAPEGWPDLFGWRAHLVTEADVGTTLAVARGVEIKAGKDRLRPAQGRFRDVLTGMGGLFEIVRD